MNPHSPAAVKRIVMRLQGGLGNQMFQYALGRKLSLLHEASLLLDLAFFELPSGRHTSRAFELGAFVLSYQRASEAQIRIAQHGGSELRAWLSSIHPRLARDRIRRESGFTFDRTVFNLDSEAYLDGYWQSEKYFSDIADVIRADFQFREPLSGSNAQIAEQITDTVSVSVHVRRGDYISQAAASAHFVSLGIDYFEGAIGYILEALPDASFFVFSDDPEWAKKNIRTSAPLYFVTHNAGHRDFEDLRLMSMCKHHIIANSSFSWWGAWLNEDKTKRVIAPSRWFTDPGMDTKDLTPASWMHM